MTYLTAQEKRARKRAEKRMLAIQKLGQGNPVCVICGCPHKEALHIGHPEHRGGCWHRREIGGRKDNSRGIVRWILKTPIEEVLERVQLECPYCNAWHNRFKEYPPKEKQPLWPITGQYEIEGLCPDGNDLTVHPDKEEFERVRKLKEEEQ